MKNNAVHCTNKYKHVTLLHAAATMLAVWSAGISFDITWGKCRLVNFFAGPCKKLVLRPNFVRMRWTQLFFQWFWIWLYGSVFHFADPHFMEIRIKVSKFFYTVLLQKHHIFLHKLQILIHAKQKIQGKVANHGVSILVTIWMVTQHPNVMTVDSAIEDVDVMR